jgi:hypothetical protein
MGLSGECQSFRQKHEHEFSLSRTGLRVHSGGTTYCISVHRLYIWLGLSYLGPLCAYPRNAEVSDRRLNMGLACPGQVSGSAVAGLPTISQPMFYIFEWDFHIWGPLCIYQGNAKVSDRKLNMSSACPGQVSGSTVVGPHTVSQCIGYTFGWDFHIWDLYVPIQGMPKFQTEG